MSSRALALVLVAVTAVAALLRAINLDGGLWFDEIVTLVMFTRPPLAAIVTEFTSNNNHPFYSVLAHLAISAFGEHPWTLRLPAFAFGVASVPMLYAVGRLFTSRAESLAATILLAVSYHAVWFAQNARGYTAITFFTLLSTWFLVRGWRDNRTSNYLFYAVAVAFGVYTHLTMVFVAVAHAIASAWQLSAWGDDDAGRPSSWRGPFAATMLAALGTIVLYGPMIPELYAFFTGPPQKTAEVATLNWAFWEMLKGLQLGLGGVGLALQALFAGVGFFSYWRQGRVTVALFVLPLFVTGAAMVVLKAPVRPRFFVFLLGFALLFVARGAALATRALVAATARSAAGRADAALGVVVGLLVVFSLASLPYNYAYPKQDFDGPLAYIEGAADPARGDVVATAGLCVYPYRDYYQRPWHVLDVHQQLETLQRGGGRIWVVYSFPEYIEAPLRDAILRDFEPVKRFPGTVGGSDVIVAVAREHR